MSHARRATLLTLLFSLVFGTLTPPAGAQRQLPVEVKIEETFVLEFKEPFETLLLDAGETTLTTNETVKVNIAPTTVFLGEKKKAVDYKKIRPGMRMDLVVEKLGPELTAKIATVKTNLEKWAVSFEGYFEKLDGDVAGIDGQAVVLESGATIKGDGQWKKQEFNSLADLMLGSLVKVKGVRKEDGRVYATELKTEPNTFSKGEREMRLKLSQNLTSPDLVQDERGAVKSLSGGVVKMGGRQFKLVESLELQTYINKIGNKLVPRYIKDQSREDPSKLLFRFYVIEDDTVNAFAFADGSVFINTGLLKILKNEAQLAAVLGHEIAHATNEHTRRTTESAFAKVLGVGNAVGVFKGDDLITFGLGVFSNKFDRDLENQADRVGLMYIYDAGYDPREAPKVWRELSSRSKENSIENFLYSSHPLARARLRNLNKEIAYNYYQTDFGQTLVRDKEYMEVVGLHFGWIKKPPPPTPAKSAVPAGNMPGTTTAPANKSRNNRPATKPRGKRP
jgi:hypothetical protein